MAIAVLKYGFTASIALPSGLIIRVPVLGFQIRYAMNEIPQATIDVPVGYNLTELGLNTTQPVTYDSVIDQLAWLPVISISGAAISYGTLGFNAGVGAPFIGYVRSVSLHKEGPTIVARIVATGLLSDLEMGSPINPFLSPASQEDFTTTAAGAGIGTYFFDHFLSGGVSMSAWLMSRRQSFNLWGLLVSALQTILTHQNVFFEGYLRLFSQLGVPIIPPTGNLRASARLATMAGMLDPAPHILPALQLMYPLFVEGLMRTIVMNPDEPSRETVLQQLLKAAREFGFAIFPTNQSVPTAYVVPNNPLHTVPAITFHPDAAVLGSEIIMTDKPDIRGVILSADGMASAPDAVLEMASLPIAAGYYDSGWHDLMTFGIYRPGGLLVLPAPLWLQYPAISDHLMVNADQGIAAAVAGNFTDLTVADYLRNLLLSSQFPLYWRLAGTCYAAAAFQALSYQGRQLTLLVPLAAYNLFGPGTNVLFPQVTFQNALWRFGKPFLGRAGSLTLHYDSSGNAYARVELHYIRSLFEIARATLPAGVILLTAHPLWRDPPVYANFLT